jgi:hypothetical protein
LFTGADASQHFVIARLLPVDALNGRLPEMPLCRAAPTTSFVVRELLSSVA